MAMNTRACRRLAIASTIAFLLFVPTRVLAQIGADDAPFRQHVDNNGVDLYAARMVVSSPTITIGSGAGNLSYSMTFRGKSFQHSFVNGIKSANLFNQDNVTVFLENSSQSFTKVNGAYWANEISGASLSVSGGVFTYTSQDGMVAVFNTIGSSVQFYGYYARLASITRPSGEKIEWHYHTQTFRTRVSRVTTTRGYALELTYASSSPFSDDFTKLTSAKLVNLIDSVATGMPTLNLSYGSNWVEFTDSAARTSRITSNSNGVSSVRHPGRTADNVTVSYINGKVSIVSSDGVITNYTRSTVAGQLRVAVLRQGSFYARYVFSHPYQLISYTDALDRVTSFQYDSFHRKIKATYPEGNGEDYSYDNRGNLTGVNLFAKIGSGTPDLGVYSAEFDLSCSNRKTCNQPYRTWKSGQATDYTYDPTHGGLLTVAEPSPVPGAARPQVRHTYAALQAWYKNSSGVVAASGVPMYLLTSTSSCRTLSTCGGLADEQVSIIDYGSTFSGRNLHPVSITERSGDWSASAVVTRTFDRAGNLTSIDGPLSGSADLTKMFYDALRRPTGAIGPYQDGVNPGINIAKKVNYDTYGRVTSETIGTTAGYGTTGWPALTAYETKSAEYDSANRVIKATRTTYAGTASVIQYSYDTFGRVDCVATRLQLSSPPASACALGASSAYGPDRIVQYAYDPADQVLTVTTALGVSGEQRVVETNTYTQNGLPDTKTDANGNKTTIEYDGIDRVWTVWYPDTNIVGQSSSTDYERFFYGMGPNLWQSRNRDGTTQSYTYDNLDRLVFIDVPNTAAEDIYYAYDNHGRLLSSRFGSVSGSGIVNSYDGLGRLQSATSFGRALSYQYNAAGQRTRLTYPDGFYVTYSRSVTGKLDSIIESVPGSPVLASFGQDVLGRRTGSIQSAGSSTTNLNFSSTHLSRLEELNHDFLGAADDLLATFTYNAAGQIQSRYIDNDVPYAWQGQTNEALSFVYNGLNQVSQVGSATIGHNANGNLATGDAVWTFSYDSSNLLRTATSTANTITLQYDPRGMLRRLDQSSGPSTELLYDGGDLVAEYDGSGALLRRYVYDDRGTPVVSYDGSSTTNKHWFHADERGSIIALSDATGDAVSTFSYSPYGKPSSPGGSRFLYTGQAYFPELGLYYYKTRFYSSQLGRFFQPDTIRYAAGLNMYSYVRGDPVNLVDPWGLHECGEGQEDSPDPHDEGGCEDVLPEVEVTDTRLSPGFGFGGGMIGGVLQSQQAHDSREACHFRPMSEADAKAVRSIMSDPLIVSRMTAAWQETLRTGNEHSFLIYNSHRGYGTGPMYQGTPRNTGPGMWNEYHWGANRNFLPPIANFHTHPPSPLSGQPSWGDSGFNRTTSSIGLVKTRFGLVSGRQCGATSASN